LRRTLVLKKDLCSFFAFYFFAKIPNDEVSDTTGDAQWTKSSYKKTNLP